MSKPDAPKPPDYAAGAEAQGQANIDAALVGASLGMPNQVNPFGSVTYSSPEYDAAMAAWMAGKPTGAGANFVPGVSGANFDAIRIDPSILATGSPAARGLAALSFGEDGQTLSPYETWEQSKPNFADYARPGQVTMTSQFSPELKALYDRAFQPLDLSGLPELGGGAYRERAEDATYNRLTRFLDERYGRQYESEQARLRDQGIFPGMEQYTYAGREFDRGRNEAYADAADRAVIAGGLEADRGLRERQQMLSEILGTRALPFGELASLRGLLPGGNGYSGGVQPAPIFDAMNAQHNANLAAYGTEAAQYGSTMNAGAQLGTTALMMFLMSDRRLKSNVRRVGTHARLGIGIYEYDLLGQRQRGVMADEVETVLPHAVKTNSRGYKMVNYGLL